MKWEFQKWPTGSLQRESSPFGGFLIFTLKIKKYIDQQISPEIRRGGFP